jgi:hypothetical protein
MIKKIITKLVYIFFIILIFLSYVYISKNIKYIKEGLKNYNDILDGHIPSENMYVYLTETDDINYGNQQVYIDISNLELTPPYSKDNFKSNLIKNDKLILDFNYFNNFSTIQSGKKYL